MRLSKYALILAGLVSSAGAMAATPTAPAVGGNPTGTININGVIRTSTCSIGSPSTTNVGFNTSKADISAVRCGFWRFRCQRSYSSHYSCQQL